MSENSNASYVDDREQNLAGDGRVSRQTTAFVLASLALAIVGVVLALEYFVVEHIPDLTEAQLDSAKKRWQEHGPANYDIDLEIRGTEPGNIHVEVRNRAATASTRDGRPTPERTWNTWSVPGMFDTLVQEIQIAEDPEKAIQAAPGTKWRLRCEFDSELGFPRRYRRMVSGGRDENWLVSQFNAR